MKSSVGRRTPDTRLQILPPEATGWAASFDSCSFPQTRFELALVLLFNWLQLMTPERTEQRPEKTFLSSFHRPRRWPLQETVLVRPPRDL